MQHSGSTWETESTWRWAKVHAASPYLAMVHHHERVATEVLDEHDRLIRAARAELAERYHTRALVMAAGARPCELGCTAFCAANAPRFHGVDEGRLL